MQRVGDMAPHKICQHAFKKNDIVWICKQCQKDETCVLCNNCFRDSCHEGHEVYFYHTQVRRAYEEIPYHKLSAWPRLLARF